MKDNVIIKEIFGKWVCVLCQDLYLSMEVEFDDECGLM